MISLRKRFFKHTALVVFITMLLSAFFIERHYIEQITEQEQQSLKLHIYALLSVAHVEDGQLTIPTILSNPKFNTPDSGLWALVFNQENQLIWQSLSSPEPLTDISFPELSATWQYGEQTINDLSYLTVSYGIVWQDETEKSYHLIVAETDQVMATAINNFRQKLIAAFGVITLFLLVLQYMVLRSAFRPISQLEREISDMEQGELKHLSKDYPKELFGVAANLNSLIDKEHKQRERYRSSMADLAHSLKTPITIIHGEMNQYPENQTLQDALVRMNSSIEYQLQRAVISGHKFLAKGTSVTKVLEMVLQAMEKIYSDKSVQISIDISENTLFYGDENDLLEVLGNLIDNAYKFACNELYIRATEDKSNMTLTIEDNGPGLPEYNQTRIFQRGERLDQQGLGQGIGLAVVYDIVKGYEGEVSAEPSEFGGVRFNLSFPKLSSQL